MEEKAAATLAYVRVEDVTFRHTAAVNVIKRYHFIKSKILMTSFWYLHLLLQVIKIDI